MKRFVNLLLLLSLVLGVTACGGKTGKDGSEKAVTFNLSAEPGSLDPQLLTDSLGNQVNYFIMEGLTREGKNGTVLPGGATSWEQDGLKYTFHLREDAKWSNGDKVTASDYLFAWERGLSPKTASQYAYMMYPIKNAEKYNNGEIKDFSKVGIKVIDENTLEVTLEKPTAYFLTLLGEGIFLPVNAEFCKEKGDDFALEADAMVYNGRYIIKEWAHGEKILLEKNPNHWDVANRGIDKINILMVNSTPTALKMFENGQLDIVKLDGDGLAKYKTDPRLATYSDGSIWYAEVNTTKKPFNNEKVRNAISLAINREALVNDIKNNGSLLSRYFVPEGIAGKDGKTFRQNYGNNVFEKFNPVKAKKLLAEGLKEEGVDISTFTFTITVGNSDTAQKEAQFYQEQLNKNLGIKVTLEPVTFQIRLQKQRSQDFDLILSGWGPDYNDPLTFMDLWVTNGGNNDVKWSNKEYDNLIKFAQNSSDNAKRMDALAKAEKILLTEMPIIPTYSRMRNILVSDKIQGLREGAVGAELKFDDVTLKESK